MRGNPGEASLLDLFSNCEWAWLTHFKACFFIDARGRLALFSKASERVCGGWHMMRWSPPLDSNPSMHGLECAVGTGRRRATSSSTCVWRCVGVVPLVARDVAVAWVVRRSPRLSPWDLGTPTAHTPDPGGPPRTPPVCGWLGGPRAPPRFPPRAHVWPGGESEGCGNNTTESGAERLPLVLCCYCGEQVCLCGPGLVSSAGDAGCSESGLTDPECWLIHRSHKGCCLLWIAGRWP